MGLILSCYLNYGMLNHLEIRLPGVEVLQAHELLWHLMLIEAVIVVRFLGPANYGTFQHERVEFEHFQSEKFGFELLCVLIYFG